MLKKKLKNIPIVSNIKKYYKLYFVKRQYKSKQPQKLGVEEAFGDVSYINLKKYYDFVIPRFCNIWSIFSYMPVIW